MIDVGTLIFVRGNRAVITGITRYGRYHPLAGLMSLLHIHYLSNGVRDVIPASIPFEVIAHGEAVPQ